MNDTFTKKRFCFFIETFITTLITIILTLLIDHLPELYIMGNKIYFIIIVLILSIVISIIWTVFNVCMINRKHKIKRGNLDLTIIKGDIFKQSNGDIIIPVDSEFKSHDYTNIDPIPKTSVQSYFMREIYPNAEEKNTKNDNKRYIYKNQSFRLFDMVELNEKDRIYLESIGSFIDELIHPLCDLINDTERGQEFYIPVMGSQVRFSGETNALSGQRRLKLLTTALEMYRFEQKVNITIVVYSDTKEDYKFDEL